MNTKETVRGAEGRSRFGYHGDEPEWGGVRAHRPATSTGVGTHTLPQAPGAAPVAAGAPGPEERLLDISELLRNIGMQYTHPFALSPGQEPDFVTVAPTHGEITLTNTGGLLLLQGHAETVLEMECGRCLNPTPQPVKTELMEQFDLVASHNAFRQEEVQAVDENAGGSVITAGGTVLDLGELLRQNLLLAAPSQPLCEAECVGPVPGAFIPGAEALYTEAAPSIQTDNPLRHLAEMLEAKRRAEAES